MRQSRRGRVRPGARDAAQAKQISDLETVLEVSRRLAGQKDLAHLITEVETADRTVLECDRATIVLHDVDTGRLYRHGVADGGVTHRRVAEAVVASANRCPSITPSATRVAILISPMAPPRPAYTPFRCLA